MLTRTLTQVTSHGFSYQRLHVLSSTYNDYRYRAANLEKISAHRDGIDNGHVTHKFILQKELHSHYLNYLYINDIVQ